MSCIAKHVKEDIIHVLQEMYIDFSCLYIRCVNIAFITILHNSKSCLSAPRLVRLTRELRLCEELEHPYIVSYYGHEFVVGAQGGAKLSASKIGRHSIGL